MGELRKDYILDEWVIVSPGRKARPHQAVEEEVVKGVSCFFCPGFEKTTPKEIGRISDKNGWLVRWVPNKFVAVEPSGVSVLKTENRFFSFASSYGFHEVVVETPHHEKQMWDFSGQEIERVLEVYAARVSALEFFPQVKYVSVFKNQGSHAGTSVPHAHSQVIAQSVVPTRVRQKVRAVRRFVECPYCAILNVERSSERRVFENADVVAFTPYASRFQYEVWIFPKAHVTRLDQWHVKSVAEALQYVLSRLKVLGCSFNMAFTYAPRGEDVHVHCEVFPRIASWGGFECGSGVVINTVTPEEAARFYRNE